MKKKNNNSKKEKLILEIMNLETNKSAKIHFPVITQNRRKWFDSLELKPDNYVILNSNFPIPEVNNAIFSPQSSLQEINYFSLLYFNEMEQSGKDIFCDLIRSGYVKVQNSREIIDLLNNLDLWEPLKTVPKIKNMQSETEKSKTGATNCITPSHFACYSCPILRILQIYLQNRHSYPMQAPFRFKKEYLQRL